MTGPRWIRLVQWALVMIGGVWVTLRILSEQYWWAIWGIGVGLLVIFWMRNNFPNP